MKWDEIEARRGRILGAMRGFGLDYEELMGSFATSLGLRPQDATALVEILSAEDLGEPLSPARLAERVDLSSGATTQLVDRLERAGYVVRSREVADRRVVTLRSSGGVAAPARDFFATLAEHLDALLTRHDPAELDRVEAFLGELRASMASALRATRGSAG